MQNIFITGRNITLSAPLKNYIKDSFKKHSNISSPRFIKVEITKEGENETFNNIKVKVSLYVGREFIKMEERGDDFYLLFNSIQKDLFSKIIKSKEKKESKRKRLTG